jgi:hypothetical protein
MYNQNNQQQNNTHDILTVYIHTEDPFFCTFSLRPLPIAYYHVAYRYRNSGNPEAER